MGKVAIVIRIFPEDMETFEDLKKAIKDSMNPVRMDEEELAFGAKAIRITIIGEDEAGSDWVEEKLKGIKGVSEVQVEGVGRL
jgi:translation elongation factor aEF-1 beta